MTNSEFQIQYWGTDVDYESAWIKQKEIHQNIVENNHPNIVALLEHKSVYTAGRSTKPEDRPFDSLNLLIH